VIASNRTEAMADWQELQVQLQAAMRADPPFPAERFAERGIVICAGGARLFTCAWVTIALLRRHLGCTLPIEVWHLGPQEMGPPMRGLLEDLSAEPVDAFDVAKRHSVERLGGWELKPYALMHSRFNEVLLLDADNIPIRDPSFLFDRQEYRETGALFWPDIVRLAPDNDIWEISGLRYRDASSFESGQMVIDKARCWRALCLTQWINQRSDVFYSVLYGDKDTFLLAWLLLAQHHHLIRYRPKLLEATLCQRDPDGALLFQHRNGAKWILNGTNPRIDGFRLEAECRALLGQLAGVWDGRIFNPPPRSDNARGLEGEIARIRVFTLRRVSSDERRIELLPDHRISSGELLERYWHVADGADVPELRIEGNGVQVCALRRSGDGSWRGPLLQPPGMLVELIPAGAGDRIADRSYGTAREGLIEVLDRVLQAGASLPRDREGARDLVGALRLLAMLDPAVIEHLRDEERRWPAGSARGWAVREALAGLADGGAIAPGSNWLNGPFRLGHGYERM
jgi:hypothetical protein